MLISIWRSKNIPKLKVIPQDIGRVMLNLINNAFYAVDKKAKDNIEGYKPIVSISLKNQDDGIEIEVKDNGNGIPDNLTKRSFNPFSLPNLQDMGLA